MEPQDYFSPSYFEARAQFMTHSAACGASTTSFEHPTARGPEGQPLFMDTAWLGPKDADTIVMSLSGTHGAEGFVGSAAQSFWLANDGRAPLPEGVAMLMIHAVNPFGFAHSTRVNENFVDLNRNGIDFSQPVPDNPLFDEAVAPLMAFHSGSIDADGFHRRMSDLVDCHGAFAIADSLNRGQYQNNRAPHYGGAKTEWSLKTLHEIIQTQCKSARHVAYIDWHTLIETADDDFVYLCFNQTDDPLFTRVGQWWGADNISREKVNAQWASDSKFATKRPARHGLIMWDIQHALAPSSDLAGAVVEFCCAPILNPPPAERKLAYESDQLLAFENAHSMDTDVVAARQRLKQAYIPERESWKSVVLPNALALYRKALAGAADWARDDEPATPGVLVRSSSFA